MLRWQIPKVVDKIPQEAFSDVFFQVQMIAVAKYIVAAPVQNVEILSVYSTQQMHTIFKKCKCHDQRW